MAYSLEAGGKRIRPVLCLACAALFDLAEEKVRPFAAGIEMIHTYSLIHDDLPAMDDDDLRRGKPSNHKAFDEATAILAGDALLTDAFLVMTKTPVPAELLLAAISNFAQAAGSSGMVGGQQLDMWHTGRAGATFQQLRDMQSLKTGAILQASCVCGALLANADGQSREKIAAYGEHLGNAFQIADDILDVVGDPALMGKPVGSDEEMGKLTCPALLGLPESRRLADEEVRLACGALDSFSGREAMFLRALARHIVERVA